MKVTGSHCRFTRLTRVVGLAATALLIGAGDLRAHSTAPDLDGDGIPNIVDPDIDNDGIPNAFDDNIDGGIARSGPYAGQYIGDHLRNSSPAEKDIDGDGLPDDSLGETDIDGDGFLDDDDAEFDIDGDGRLDDDDSERDIDGDGRLDDDEDEDDIDGDGTDDDEDEDTDGDGLRNEDSAEHDTDGDGRDDAAADEHDTDGDNVHDRDDEDDDNDRILDEDDDDFVPEEGEEGVEIRLTATAAAPNESASQVEIEQLGTGKIAMKVKVEGLVDGNYEVVIGGLVRATLHVVGGEDELEFETNPNDPKEIAIDFPVLGQPISIRQSGVTFFTGTIPTP